ncbi:ParB N-terminal domain-containing protein [Hellea balneolensis]|uniref:ParB N-terminal domain-containing protein n=1 Tax=Hellea balneolensis TaxID=287478 RepID=UPI0003FF1B59|nr:ParB N-terminal domain-containing protein [Hellea balneolensis]
MLPTKIKMAKLSRFRAPTTRILYGERLKDVTQIQASVLKHGLLSPLLVVSRGQKLIVVDGKKRLSALRRMRFSGDLPRSLVRVPYILVNHEEGKYEKNDAETPVKKLRPMNLLSNQERFEEVTKLRHKGYGLMEIASELYVSKSCVKDLLRVALLSPRLRQAYFGGTISIEQARAFASLPNTDAQDQLLIALGPFADAPEILKAIENGETVIEMADDNVIILPSRRPLTPYRAGPETIAA